MRFEDVLTIAAIILGPILAVQISTYLQRRRDKLGRKEWVFKTLMATRATRVSTEHVRALNMIDIEFYDKSKWRHGTGDKAVVDAWKAYLDLLRDTDLRDRSPDLWNSKTYDSFIELMHRMAVCLGYDFDKTAIKNTSYMPAAHGELEVEQAIIRKGFVAIFSGRDALPMKVMQPEEQRRHEEERQATTDQLLAQLLLKMQEPAGLGVGDPALPAPTQPAKLREEHDLEPESL